MLVALFVTFNLFEFSECEMKAKVVGGKEIKIARFPHIALIGVYCDTGDGMEAWKCGSSILNQKLLLTAGHCVSGCLPKSSIIATVGHRDHDQGYSYSTHSFMKHEYYNDNFAAYDIALIRLKTPMELGAAVSRIALMENPPYGESAMVAGWGLINEDEVVDTNLLQTVSQIVHNATICQKWLGYLPEGTFCASSGDTNHYVSFGDSGGPLVVRGYIQIGLVSYKLPHISKDVIVYTDTGHYYNWINKNSKKILFKCNK